VSGSWAPPAIFLVLGFAAFSGCVSTKDDEQPWSLREIERGTYVLTEDQEPIGQVEVDVRWRDSYVEAMANVLRPDGARSSATMQFAVNTGELLQVQRDNSFEFPWGVEKYMPSGHRIPLVGASNADLARPGTPLGPQWGLLGGHAHGAWGEIEWDAAVQGGNWTLTASGPCQSQCGLQGLGEKTLRVKMSGLVSDLLPARVEYGFGDRADLVVLQRISHASEGPRFAPISVIPTLQDSGSQELCGLVPCEPADWPPRISIKRGMDSLLASPQWAAWALQHPQGIPIHLEVVENGEVSLDGNALANLPPWILVFHEGNSRGDFRLSALQVEGQDVLPPVVRQWSENPIPDEYAQATQTWPILVVPMEDVIAGMLAVVNVTLDDVHRLAFLSLPQAHFPDSRASLVWVAYVGAPTNYVLFGSAVTGSPLAVQALESA